LEADGMVRRPAVPSDCEHNAHIYWLVLQSLDARRRVIDQLHESGIQAVFHYVPLHSSPAGKRFGRAAAPLPVTDDMSDRILRLPMWAELGDAVDEVIERVSAAVRAA
jgi:dTDP-4-amino-4,6-dideoxygalactose transaminase